MLSARASRNHAPPRRLQARQRRAEPSHDDADFRNGPTEMFDRISQRFQLATARDRDRLLKWQGPGHDAAPQ